MPEAQIHASSPEGEALYTHDPGQYPLERIRAVAERAARRDLSAVPALVADLLASDPAVRYWAAAGLLVRGQDAVRPHQEKPRSISEEDNAPTVQVVAAEALARYGTQEDPHQAR